MIFYCSMEPDPNPSSNNDKVPSFFSEGDKTTENLHFEKIKKNDSIESSSKTTKQSSKPVSYTHLTLPTNREV